MLHIWDLQTWESTLSINVLGSLYVNYMVKKATKQSCLSSLSEIFWLCHYLSFQWVNMWNKMCYVVCYFLLSHTETLRSRHWLFSHLWGMGSLFTRTLLWLVSHYNPGLFFWSKFLSKTNPTQYCIYIHRIVQCIGVFLPHKCKS